ncbi:hypothetical protein BJ165DRAFT_1404619 [Panaeolus papilionaceus]|nr:hypothetical protein BJ165DRAFT_1404619 [Panaeolus papilionaceus]
MPSTLNAQPLEILRKIGELLLLGLNFVAPPSYMFDVLCRRWSPPIAKGNQWLYDDMEAFIRARREDLVEVHLLRTRLGPVMPFHDPKKLRCVTLEKWGPQDGDPILDNFSAAVKNGDLRQLEAITIKLRPCWPTGSEGDALDKILRNYPPACRLYG